MTKQKQLILYFVTLIWIFGITSVQAVPIISLTVSDDYIEVNEDFSVQVSVDGDGIGQTLLGFGFDFEVTGSAFVFKGYDTDFIGDFSTPGTGYIGGGDVFLQDDVLLASLNFRAVAAKDGTLNISGLYDGFTRGLIYSDVDPFSPVTNPLDYTISGSETISVNTADAPVPEPTTFVLFSLGLLGLARFSRRKA